MKNDLINEIKKMQGSVLAIGIQDQKIINALQKNNQITECNLLDSVSKKSKGKGKKKKITLKKLKKMYKKKKSDYVIGNVETLQMSMRPFIKINVFVNSNKTYLFGSEEQYDSDKLKHRYLRYTKNIDFKKDKQNYLMIIDLTNSKNNKIKEFFYSIIDILVDAIDIFSDVLTN